jgi:hypothetical protein
MKIPMDQILAGYVDHTLETAGLRRNGADLAQDLVLAETLAKLEASGDAMRFVDGEGRIVWKATPSLCQYLKDLELDAQEDLEDL